MASRRLPVCFFTSVRTPDIVRDADILHLYKKAGMQYILLGIESVEPKVLEEIKKGSTTLYDLEACRLLKKHGIFSIVAHVIGLQEETWKTFRNAIKQLIYYDGDFVNVTHVTPHSWTEFGHLVKDRPVVEPDLGKWDYRHQILAQKHLSPWKIFLAAKWLEYRIHGRPRRLWSIWKTQDRFLRRLLIWSFIHTGFVWFAEILVWLAEVLIKTIKPSKKYSNITVNDVSHNNFSLGQQIRLRDYT
ncbi:MAG: radical SAM protein [Deltaproteobacteria bacterium]|nr:radical SAM protein [Deltaproteobacteria bacterium]